MRFGIVELYCGQSGKIGYYNSQELGLARALRQLGYEPVVFFPTRDLEHAEETNTSDNIKLVHVPAKTLGVHACYDWSILLKYRIDVARVASDNQLFTTDLVRYCDKNKIPICCYIGIIDSENDNFFKRMIQKPLLQRTINVYKTHCCIAKTPFAAKELEKHGVSDVKIAPVGLDISVIPAVIQTKEQLRERMGLPQDKAILLYVGRLSDEKCPLEAINLLNMLKDRVYLVMIGTGNLDNEIEQEIKQRGLQEHVTRIKELPNAEVHSYYVACDYYVNFCRTEIFGMSLLEAMWQDCSVMAYHAPGPDYIIENGISGYLVKDTIEMAALIRDGRRLQSGCAHRRIEEYFTWDKTARIMIDTLKQGKCHEVKDGI